MCVYNLFEFKLEFSVRQIQTSIHTYIHLKIVHCADRQEYRRTCTYGYTSPSGRERKRHKYTDNQQRDEN